MKKVRTYDEFLALKLESQEKVTVIFELPDFSKGVRGLLCLHAQGSVEGKFYKEMPKESRPKQFSGYKLVNKQRAWNRRTGESGRDVTFSPNENFGFKVKKKFGWWIVDGEVDPESLKKGIRKGQRVARIDGRELATLSLREVEELLKPQIKSVQVTVIPSSLKHTNKIDGRKWYLALDGQVIFYDHKVPAKYGGPQWRLTFDFKQAAPEQPLYVNRSFVEDIWNGHSSNDRNWSNGANDEYPPLEKWYYKLPADRNNIPQEDKTKLLKFVFVDLDNDLPDKKTCEIIREHLTEKKALKPPTT